MRRILRWFRRVTRPKDTLITIKVYRDHVLHNLHVFQQEYSGARIAPVLKSNAYGHGLLLVAEILKKEDIPFFVVDSHHEARLLRLHGVRTPLLVIGYTPASVVAGNLITHVAFTITSLEHLRQIADVATHRVVLHMKIDTGMHRQGVAPSDVDEAITLIRSNSSLKLEGVCSHFADAEVPDSSVTKNQIITWKGVLPKLRENFPDIAYIHLLNTAGTSLQDDLGVNVHRLGLGLYGMDEREGRKLDLKPALAVETIVTSVRTIETGESIGYNATFIAPAPMKVATIPMGYAEGLDRRLSGKGVVSVCGAMCPIVGRVSMNITSIDVTHILEVKIGDVATVLSADVTAPNSAEAIARSCETIQRDILVGFPQYLRRVVV